MRPLAVLLSSVLFTEPVLSAVNQSHIWEERSVQLARLSSMKGSPSLFNALPDLAPASRHSKSAVNPVSSGLNSWARAVPHAFASIRETNVGTDKGRHPILLIQDVHAHVEAQSNIAQLLDVWMGRGGIAAVGVEGAFEPLDFRRLRTFPDSVRTRVAQLFLSNNRLAATSYAGWVSKRLPPLFAGVDDRSLHAENINAYLTTGDLRTSAEETLARMEPELQEEKRRVLNPDLFQFDVHRGHFRAGRLGLGAYLDRLSDTGASLSLALQQFKEAHEMETGLDFARAAAERQAVMDILSAKLTEKELNRLLNRALAHRSGQMGLGDFYREFRVLCESHGIDLERRPYFENYLRYVLLSDSINPEIVLRDLSALEASIEKNLTLNEKETRVLARSSWIGLAQKLLRFELTPLEWDQYQHLKNVLSGDVVPGRVGDLVAVEAFYRAADDRSVVMVDRLRESASGGALVLVAGGFHTAAIAARLKKENASYLIVSPRLTRIDDGQSYLSAFSREKTPLERMFSGQKLFIADPSTGLGHKPLMREALVASAMAAMADGIPVPSQSGIRVTPQPDGTVKIQGDDLPTVEAVPPARMMPEGRAQIGTGEDGTVFVAPKDGKLTLFRSWFYTWFVGSWLEAYLYAVITIVLARVIYIFPMLIIGDDAEFYLRTFFLQSWNQPSFALVIWSVAVMLIPTAMIAHALADRLVDTSKVPSSPGKETEFRVEYFEGYKKISVAFDDRVEIKRDWRLMSWGLFALVTLGSLWIYLVMITRVYVHSPEHIQHNFIAGTELMIHFGTALFLGHLAWTALMRWLEADSGLLSLVKPGDGASGDTSEEFSDHAVEYVLREAHISTIEVIDLIRSLRDQPAQSLSIAAKNFRDLIYKTNRSQRGADQLERVLPKVAVRWGPMVDATLHGNQQARVRIGENILAWVTAGNQSLNIRYVDGEFSVTLYDAERQKKQGATPLVVPNTPIIVDNRARVIIKRKDEGFEIQIQGLDSSGDTNPIRVIARGKGGHISFGGTDENKNKLGGALRFAGPVLTTEVGKARVQAKPIATDPQSELHVTHQDAEGSAAGQDVQMPARFEIGRVAPKNDASITLAEGSVSQHHALVTHEPYAGLSVWNVEDLLSTNGTRVLLGQQEIFPAQRAAVSIHDDDDKVALLQRESRIVGVPEEADPDHFHFEPGLILAEMESRNLTSIEMLELVETKTVGGEVHPLTMPALEFFDHLQHEKITIEAFRTLLPDYVRIRGPEASTRLSAGVPLEMHLPFNRTFWVQLDKSSLQLKVNRDNPRFLQVVVYDGARKIKTSSVQNIELGKVDERFIPGRLSIEFTEKNGAPVVRFRDARGGTRIFWRSRGIKIFVVGKKDASTAPVRLVGTGAAGLRIPGSYYTMEDTGNGRYRFTTEGWVTEARMTASGITLGREANCDVYLDDRRVSRYHANVRQITIGSQPVIEIQNLSDTNYTGVSLLDSALEALPIVAGPVTSQQLRTHLQASDSFFVFDSIRDARRQQRPQASFSRFYIEQELSVGFIVATRIDNEIRLIWIKSASAIPNKSEEALAVASQQEIVELINKSESFQVELAPLGDEVELTVVTAGELKDGLAAGDIMGVKGGDGRIRFVRFSQSITPDSIHHGFMGGLGMLGMQAGSEERGLFADVAHLGFQDLNGDNIARALNDGLFILALIFALHSLSFLREVFSLNQGWTGFFLSRIKDSIHVRASPQARRDVAFNSLAAAGITGLLLSMGLHLMNSDSAIKGWGIVHILVVTVLGAYVQRLAFSSLDPNNPIFTRFLLGYWISFGALMFLSRGFVKGPEIFVLGWPLIVWGVLYLVYGRPAVTSRNIDWMISLYRTHDHRWHQQVSPILEIAAQTNKNVDYKPHHIMGFLAILGETGVHMLADTHEKVRAILGVLARHRQRLFTEFSSIQFETILEFIRMNPSTENRVAAIRILETALSGSKVPPEFSADIMVELLKLARNADPVIDKAINNVFVKFFRNPGLTSLPSHLVIEWIDELLLFYQRESRAIFLENPEDELMEDGVEKPNHKPYLSLLAFALKGLIEVSQVNSLDPRRRAQNVDDFLAQIDLLYGQESFHGEEDHSHMNAQRRSFLDHRGSAADKLNDDFSFVRMEITLEPAPDDWSQLVFRFRRSGAGAWAGLFMAAARGLGLNPSVAVVARAAAIMEGLIFSVLLVTIGASLAVPIWLVVNFLAHLFGVVSTNPATGRLEIITAFSGQGGRFLISTLVSNLIAATSFLALFPASYDAPFVVIALAALAPHVALTFLGTRRGSHDLRRDIFSILSLNRMERLKPFVDEQRVFENGRVWRVELPSDFEANTPDLRLLKAEIGPAIRADFLFNAWNELVAVIPVVEDGMDRHQFQYMSFASLHPVPRIGDPDFEAKWKIYVEWRQNDEKLIRAYLASPAVSGPIGAVVPTDSVPQTDVVVGMLSTTLEGVAFASPSVKTIPQELEEIRKDRGSQHLLGIVPPGVYSAGDIDHYIDDRHYHSAVLRFDQAFRALKGRDWKTDRKHLDILVLGGGVDVWVMQQALLLARERGDIPAGTRWTITSRDPNPLAGAYVRHLADRHGFDVVTEVGANIPHGRTFDMIFWDAPAFVPEGKGFISPMRGQQFFDGDDGGQAWRQVARALPHALRDKDSLFIAWNIAHFATPESTVDDVAVMLKSAARETETAGRKLVVLDDPSAVVSSLSRPTYRDPVTLYIAGLNEDVHSVRAPVLSDRVDRFIHWLNSWLPLSRTLTDQAEAVFKVREDRVAARTILDQLIPVESRNVDGAIHPDKREVQLSDEVALRLAGELKSRGNDLRGRVGSVIAATARAVQNPLETISMSERIRSSVEEGTVDSPAVLHFVVRDHLTDGMKINLRNAASQVKLANASGLRRAFLVISFDENTESAVKAEVAARLGQVGVLHKIDLRDYEEDGRLLSLSGILARELPFLGVDVKSLGFWETARIGHFSDSGAGLTTESRFLSEVLTSVDRDAASISDLLRRRNLVHILLEMLSVPLQPGDLDIINTGRMRDLLSHA